MINRRKILVIDDDPDILEIIGMILKEEGFDVELMKNGMNIFEHIYEFGPDLIILDVMLGNMDGREICNNIKSTLSTSHIPVILISASYDIYELGKKNCTPDDFLEKPFDLMKLIHKVELKLSA